MDREFRVLSIAVATGRMACVLMVGGKLKDWRLSKKAARSSELAERQAQCWIRKFTPHVVVTEAVPARSTKSKKTRSLINAVSRASAARGVHDARVSRASKFKNKYEEARALANRFPDIEAWVPKKPKIWESEPRNTVYFEALTLALQVVDAPEPRDDAAASRQKPKS